MMIPSETVDRWAALVDLLEAHIRDMMAENIRLTQVLNRRERERFEHVFLPEALGVHRPHARLAMMLWAARERPVSYITLHEALRAHGIPAQKMLKVYICDLRRAMGCDIPVISKFGYRFSPEAVARLDALSAQHKAEYYV